MPIDNSPLAVEKYPHVDQRTEGISTGPAILPQHPPREPTALAWQASADHWRDRYCRDRFVLHYRLVAFEMNTPQTTPLRLQLKKDTQLEIDWQDGLHSVYSISYLRSLCPCAQCRIVRDGSDPHDISPAPKPKPLLTILPGNYSGQITVTHAERVGNYALKLVFSDQHDSGIFSFEYLREIAKPA